MRTAYPEIIEALTSALAARGLAGTAPQLMPIEPPRAWGVTTNVCFALGKQAAAEEIAARTQDLPAKQAKQIAAQVGKEASELLAMGVAAELSRAALPCVARVEAEGAYINFYYDTQRLVAHVVDTVTASPWPAAPGDPEVLKDATLFGHGMPTGKRVMVEYAQPNTHKDFHVGHLRNASIGQAIANLLEFDGHEVYKATYIGDVGKHVAIWHWFKSYEVSSIKLLQALINTVQRLDEADPTHWGAIYKAGTLAVSLLLRIRNNEIPQEELGEYDPLEPEQQLDRLADWLFSWEWKIVDLPMNRNERIIACLIEFSNQYPEIKQKTEIMINNLSQILNDQLKLDNSLDEFETIESAYPVINNLFNSMINTYNAIIHAKSEEYSSYLDNALNEIDFQLRKHFETYNSMHQEVRFEWQDARTSCIIELTDVFTELLISFSSYPDLWFFESSIDEMELGQKTATELKNLNIATIDESPEYKGALYVDFEKQADAVRPDGTPVFREDEKKRIRKLGKMTILRSDGTSLYQTKELGLARYKFDLIREKTGHELDESLYVVGAEQKLHFEQVFAILRLWGFPNAEHCKHISYELVVLPEGKMSSREGTVVSYRELRDEAVKRAELITREKGIGASDSGGTIDEGKVRDIAHKIAIAAIKYAMLQVTGSQQITFNFEQALSFDGRAAPYLQYAYARAGKLVAGMDKPDSEPAADKSMGESRAGTPAPPSPAGTRALQEIGYELHPSEVELARQISLFPSVCRDAAANYEPATLCTCLYALATAFSEFYRDCRVLDAPALERSFRQRLTRGFRQVLRTGFAILALPLPEEM